MTLQVYPRGLAMARELLKLPDLAVAEPHVAIKLLLWVQGLGFRV